MKRIQRFVALFVLLISSVAASAYDIYSNGIYYNVVSESEKTVEVTHGPNYNEYTGDVVLTGYVDGFKVVAIGNSAFWGCSEMTSVTIPSTVTRIGSAAFGCTGITSITIPHTVTEIASDAFNAVSNLESIYVEDWGGKYGNGTNGANCIVDKETQTLIAGCKNTVIPTDITTIGECAFEQNHSLTSITIPDNVTSIGSYAFYNCSRLASITLPGSLTRIEDWAFANCIKLTSIDLPYSLEYIGDCAFGWCTGLTYLWLPSSVTSMCENNPWQGCYNLQTIEVDGGNPVYDSRGCNIIVETATGRLVAGCQNSTIPEGITSIGRDAFHFQYNLAGIDIPEGVTTIEYEAFEGCNNLQWVNLPSTLEILEGFAFSGTALTSVSIPASVKYIEYCAFYGCEQLQDVYIGSGVTSIGNQAFDYCPNLRNVYCYAENPPTIYDYTFGFNNTDSNMNPENITLSVPNACLPLYQTADYWSAFTQVNDWLPSGDTHKWGDLYYTILSDTEVEVARYPEGEKYSGYITIPSTVGGYTVTSIANSAFYECKDLYGVEIPQTVQNIGNAAFRSTSISSITIPNGVTKLSETFWGCKNLTSLYIPESVTSIDRWTILFCSSLTSVVVAGNNPVYDSRQNCNAIIETATNTLIQACETTIIPNNVVAIGPTAFAGVENTSINIPIGIKTIGQAAFMRCTKLTSINLPDGLTSIGNQAFSYDSCLVSIRIPETVTEIGWGAFERCVALQSLTLPGSLHRLRDGLIYNCTALESVTLSEGIEAIEDEAICECPNLASITIPSTVTSIGTYFLTACTGLTSIVVDDANAVYDSRGNCNAIIETATNKLVSGCKATIIPNSVDTIGQGAFCDQDLLTSIYIPNGVEKIKCQAFAFTGLTSISIPVTVTEIERLAFQGDSRKANVLKTLKVFAMTPPQVQDTTFVNNVVYDEATLYVPAGTKALYASTSPWSKFQDIRDELLGNGRFYFQNVASGKYWGAGNDWGTQATLVEHPEFMDIALLDDGRYTLESQVNNGGQQYYFNGDYMDWAIASAAPVTVNEVSEGIYTVANDSAYYGWDGESTVLCKTLTDANSANAQWRLISEADLRTTLGGATYSNPVDATFLIKDANFGRNNRYYGYWTWEHSGAVNHDNGGDNTNFCVESYHVPFRFYQTLSGVPNGVYELTAQGYYRQDGTDAENLPYLFMNEERQVFSPCTENENDMATASRHFSAGMYRMAPIIVKVTDNTITLGTELEENTGLWCIWDNFELTYYGDTEIDAVKNMALLNQLRELRRTAQGLRGNEGISAAADQGLTDALTATEDFDYTQAGLTQAIEVLSTAINRAQAAIAAQPKIEAANEEMAATNVYTAEALAAYKAVYDEAQQKYDEGTLTLEEANALENPHLFTFDQQGGNNILKNLLLSAWSVNADAASESTTNLRHQYVSGVNYLRYSTTNEDAVVTATIPNVADGTYAVTVDVETSASEGVLTLQVGEGTATNVVANQVEANGVVSGGVLTITFNVPADLSWFRFRNMVYTRTGDADGGYAKALETIESGKEYIVSTVYNDKTYYLKENGYLTDEQGYAGIFTFERAEQEGTFMPVGWMLNNAAGTNFTNGGNQNNILVDNYYIHTSIQARKAWEGQVLYLADNGKYAVRSTNATSASWGASAFWTVIDDTDGDDLPQAAYTLEEKPYIWNVVEPAENQEELKEMLDLMALIRATMAQIRSYAATVEEESEAIASYVNTLNSNFNDLDGQLDELNTLADLQDALQWVKDYAVSLVKKLDAVEGGRDVTGAFIVNAQPTTNADGWTVTNSEGNPGSVNAFDPTNNVAEFWRQAAYRLSQQLYLPAGDYVLSVVALTRAAGSANNLTFEDMNAYLYAGEAQANIALADPAAINSRLQANEWFNEGNGVTELPFSVAKDGAVTIGLITDNTYPDYWLVWRNFTLKYTPAVDNHKKGDVNEDDKVNVGDVVAVYNVMLGKTTYTYADVNEDNKVNVGDVVAIYNVMLGKNSNVKEEMNVKGEGLGRESLMASVADNDLHIGIENVRAYTAFQMAVRLPEGMTLEEVAFNSATDHQLAWEQMADGRYLIMGASATSAELEGNMDDLLTLQLTGTAEGNIIVDEVVFATTDATAYDVNGLTLDAATGIMAIDNGQLTMDNYYDLSGRRVLKPTKGIYIVNGKKVSKK